MSEPLSKIIETNDQVTDPNGLYIFTAPALIDELTTLIFNGTNISDDNGKTINEGWKKFVEYRTSRVHQWGSYIPTNLTEQIFNTLNSWGQSPLYLAYRYNREQVIRVINNMIGVNYNIKNSNGDTVLHGIAWEKSVPLEKREKNISHLIKIIKRENIFSPNLNGEKWYDLLTS